MQLYNSVTLKKLALLPWLFKWALISHFEAGDGVCPCCGYVGPFRAFGNPVRTNCGCPGPGPCESLERHRLFELGLQRGAFNVTGKDVLHFAAEGAVRRSIQKREPKSYRTSTFPGGNGDLHLNLEAIDLPDASLDVVVASHILEHVDDAKALAEIARVLRPGGILLAMVPLIEGWAETYENDAITSELDRMLHFGQNDHVRYYGADFRDRIAASGLVPSDFGVNGEDSVTYRIERGEKVFIGTKP